MLSRLSISLQRIYVYTYEVRDTLHRKITRSVNNLIWILWTIENSARYKEFEIKPKRKLILKTIAPPKVYEGDIF